VLDLAARLPADPPVACMKAAETLIDEAEAWWMAVSNSDSAAKLLKENRDRILRTQIGELLDILLTWFRDLAIAGEEGAETLLINADRAAELRRAAAQSPDCAAAAGAVTEAKIALRGNANLRLTAEVMLIRLRQALTAGSPAPTY
jgi:hypothetical protein